MAARTKLVSKRAPYTRVTFTDTVDLWRRASALARMPLAKATARQPRARLGLLGVPLAITASLMAGVWWTALPLALCAWWWSPRNAGWEWVGAVGRGLVGAEWAFIGSSAIVSFPHDLPIVGALWSFGAGLIGLCGSEAARQINHDVAGRSRQGGAVQMRRSGAPSVRRRFAMHLTHQRTPSGARKRH
jgi:hypothetical protein